MGEIWLHGCVDYALRAHGLPMNRQFAATCEDAISRWAGLRC